MHGWMGGWVDGWMGRWMDGWMGRWMDSWIGGWVDRSYHLQSLFGLECNDGMITFGESEGLLRKRVRPI
jgi:hypothetical protein